MLELKARVAFVSTYPPRECGIATFTRDLERALLVCGQVTENTVVAINEDIGNFYSDSRVECTIEQHDRESYLTAADFLNNADVDVVSIQHEYGIYGGEWGEYVLDLIKYLQKPIVPTFHTVLRDPPKKAKRITCEMADRSEFVIVTIESAAKLLKKHYGVKPEKVRVVRHGVALPDVVRNDYAKRFLGLQKKTVLATFGLMSSGKGIEHAIKALAYLVKERPDLVYIVIGETHPEVRKREGEAYREYLTSLASRLGVERNVRFINRYLAEDELSQYLQAVDVYVAPYLGKDQVSSGTMTLALGHGRAIVATPSTFAMEVLAENRGLWCKFADARSLAECVERILGNPRLKRELEANAFKYGQDVGWARVAKEYGDIFRSASSDAAIISEAATVREA